MDGLRSVLDPWLGEAQWKQSRGRVTFGYRFMSEDVPSMRLRLKVEINTREHFAVFGFTRRPFSVASRWYSGTAAIATFELDELLATKLRALHQRRKGRDLFDLATGLADERSDAERIVAAFREYMDRDGHRVTRAMFERNLAGKLGDPQFGADMSALPRQGYRWRTAEAARTVSDRLISLLPGEPWKGGDGWMSGRKSAGPYVARGKSGASGLLCPAIASASTSAVRPSPSDCASWNTTPLRWPKWLRPTAAVHAMSQSRGVGRRALGRKHRLALVEPREIAPRRSQSAASDLPESGRKRVLRGASSWSGCGGSATEAGRATAIGHGGPAAQCPSCRLEEAPFGVAYPSSTT